MNYPNIDPVLVNIWGPLQIRWYGLMYVIGFVLAFLIINSASKRRQNGLSRLDIEDLFAYSIAGLIIGARLGYCIIYDFSYFMLRPIEIFMPWNGGMSFHGGLIGLLAAGYIFAKRRRKNFLMLADMGALGAPPGLFFGRIGNFINGELYGRVTDVPWGMIFPGGGPLPRHPSQLYEASLEGLVLFLIVFGISFKSKINGMLLSAFLFFYGLFRFILEFFRQPDVQKGFVIGPFSMGQVLCFMMMALGIYVFFYARSRKEVENPVSEKQTAVKRSKPKNKKAKP
ncbi:MAG TPA: prolipoprotein diacylglyceryl transferase [Desulfomonilia bacterium]|jgi:phosphatidylglycerol:prolipoprotein diacylglycerol transferase